MSGTEFTILYGAGMIVATVGAITGREGIFMPGSRLSADNIETLPICATCGHVSCKETHA